MTTASIQDELYALKITLEVKLDYVRDAETITDTVMLLDKLIWTRERRLGAFLGNGEDDNAVEWGHPSDTLEGMEALLED